MARRETYAALLGLQNRHEHAAARWMPDALPQELHRRRLLIGTYATQPPDLFTRHNWKNDRTVYKQTLPPSSTERVLAQIALQPNHVNRLPPLIRYLRTIIPLEREAKNRVQGLLFDPLPPQKSDYFGLFDWLSLGHPRLDLVATVSLARRDIDKRLGLGALSEVAHSLKSIILEAPLKGARTIDRPRLREGLMEAYTMPELRDVNIGVSADMSRPANQEIFVELSSTFEHLSWASQLAHFRRTLLSVPAAARPLESAPEHAGSSEPAPIEQREKAKT